MKRLFTAIRIRPDEVFLDRFRLLQNHLRHERIKWVEEHNIHITLKFFGETEGKRIPEIIRVHEAIAMNWAPFSVVLRSSGVFGSKYDPRVVWIGIEPYDKLAGLMRLFREKMAEIGFEPDRQNLVPHLTLGRIKEVKDKKGFSEVLERYRDIASEELRITEFYLFESILRREGPEYRVIQSFTLSSPSSTQ